MNKYAVYYKYDLEHEAIVRAKTEKEAIEKVKEVIGDDVKIITFWKLKEGH